MQERPNVNIRFNSFWWKYSSHSSMFQWKMALCFLQHDYILWFTISIHVTHVRPYAALGSRAVSRPLAAHCSEPNCLPPPQGSPWEVPPLPSLRPVAKRAVRGGKDGSAV